MAMRRSILPGDPGRRPAKPRVSDDDRALWEALIRQAQPLRRPTPAPKPASPPPQPATAGAPPPSSPPRVASAPPSAVPLRPAPVPRLVVGQRAPGMDDLGWATLTRRPAIHRRTLDLHGRTVQAAYLALHDFLERAHRDGVRHVEIITGRGSAPGVADGVGAIRRELPHWLNAPALRRLLLGAAHPHPRNPGSVRLLLRRRKA